MMRCENLGTRALYPAKAIVNNDICFMTSPYCLRPHQHTAQISCPNEALHPDFVSSEPGKSKDIVKKYSSSIQTKEINSRKPYFKREILTKNINIGRIELKHSLII